MRPKARVECSPLWDGQAGALALSDEGAVWTRYADIALRRAEALKGNERRNLQREALKAATNGYLRAADVGAQVYSLQIMARALEVNRRGRDIIPALRLALSFSPREDLERALDDAIGKYGFRITDHRVENNAAAPRICADFSEKLVQTGVDYELFVRVAGRGLVVQAGRGAALHRRGRARQAVRGDLPRRTACRKW